MSIRSAIEVYKDIERVTDGKRFSLAYRNAGDEEKADFIAESLGKRINQIVVEKREEDGK